ncbi:leucine-rich alpha-2-glycoprotein-like [Notolabrus celidotus]|uniref:leucine-rich alpha-2-glycoprotein-like n=1 Tax=Notolabrus celidotus TaxID=1203425 RepID=UPI00148FEA58|nr:leucine-rich alpha-2-glycoprotein-like [Notolabrus celidotus]
MNCWILFIFTTLAECLTIKRAAHSCPELCSCSFSTLGAEVECSQESLRHFSVDGLTSNTTRLSILSTNLSSITAHHLSAVPLLKSLQLYHTNLTSLPADLLKDVPHLNSLDLTGNRLLHLPPNVFNHYTLRSLVLKNNLIEEADAEWFSDNSSLTWLDLSGNLLSGISTTLLHKLPNLENLDLSDNYLQDLQPDVLTNLHQLESLNLAGNKLISLKSNTFIHNLKLSQLFLQENRLQELHATLLKGLHHLELLLLNQNQLQNLPQGLLDEKKSSFRVILTGNPWVCDDKIEYLWKWLTAHPQNVFFLEGVTCAGPGALKQQPVFSLSDTDGLSWVKN